MALVPTKTGKNPCRDARTAPSVSFWYRRVSKQASARRHQKETAFVPQACITARKTGKTANAAIFTQPTQSPDGAVSGREYDINAEGPKPYTPVPTKG